MAMLTPIRLLLVRHLMSEKETLGYLYTIQSNGKVFNSFATLELPWKDNERGISCVPEGEYPIILERSSKFRMTLWELKDVPNRSEVKIHPANYTSQIEGCIALGTDFSDINEDGIIDVINSRHAFKNFQYTMAGQKESTIKIVNYAK